MAKYLRKHLAFNTAKEKQLMTAEFLDKVGKKKSELISDLVYGYLRDNGITDVSQLTDKDAHGLIQSADVKRKVISNEEIQKKFEELLKFSKKQQRKLQDIEHTMRHTRKIPEDVSESEMVQNEPSTSEENTISLSSDNSMVQNEPFGTNSDNIEDAFDEGDDIELDLEEIAKSFQALM